MTGHDLVLSSSVALAKGVITRPGQPHIAYIHSPARYAWDQTHAYINSLGGPFGRGEAASGTRDDASVSGSGICARRPRST